MSKREELMERYKRGEKLEFLFFYGHRSAEGVVDMACLSQWYPCTFQVDGIEYRTAEQYMMAQKAVLFGDEVTRKKIMEAAGPSEYKKLGRKVQHFKESVWEEKKYFIVLQGSLAKFSQNEALKSFLLSTKDKILVEASPYDTVWGIGLGKNEPDVHNPMKWRGENLLGFALMEAREALK